MDTYISFIWILFIVTAFLVYVGVLIFFLPSAPDDSSRVMGLFVFTIGMLLSLVSGRIVLELIIVVFRIETHLRTIREKYENT